MLNDSGVRIDALSKKFSTSLAGKLPELVEYYFRLYAFTHD
jgi:hypothetical protein